MPSIKGRMNNFLQRQLTFVSSSSTTTSSTNNNEVNSESSSSTRGNAQVRRSQSFKENESIYRRKTSSKQQTTTTTTTSSSTTTAAAKNKSLNDADSKGIKVGTFITSYLNGQLNKHQPDIICGKTCYDLPVKRINKLSPKLNAAYTGPGAGLTVVNKSQLQKPFQIDCDTDIDFIDDDCLFDSIETNNSSNNSNCTNNNNNKPGRINSCSSSSTPSTSQSCSPKSSTSSASSSSPSLSSSPSMNKEIFNEKTIIDDSFYKANTLPLGQDCAGIANWMQASDYAYGIATTLYECHPQTALKAGEPIADAFAIAVRENSAILCLADGVNWGEKACIAARSAIHGSMDYLNKAIYHESGRIQNTLDIFVALLRSFSAAHSLILQENGLLTTLTVAIVAQLENSDRFIVCTCNVGDSLAYIYSKEYGVREVTQGSHDIFSMRDMRDALGALGPVDGQNPELNNLTVAMTVCDIGDIVFLTSDGVSDNFDPVVGKFALPKKEDKSNYNNNNNNNNNLTDNKDKQSSVNSNVATSPKHSNINNNHIKPSNNNNENDLKSPNKSKISSRRLIQNIANVTSKHTRTKVHRSNSNPDKLIKEHTHRNHHHHHHSNSSSNNNNNNNNNNHLQTNKNNSKTSHSNLHKQRHPPQYHQSLPIVSAEQRHALALLRMEDLLFHGFNTVDSKNRQCSPTAKSLCEIMIEFVQKLTMAKRHILEDPELYNKDQENDFDQSEQKHRRRKVCDKLAMVPGKLDHATIVAYQVGFYGEMANKVLVNKSKALNASSTAAADGEEKNHNLRLKATLAQFDD